MAALNVLESRIENNERIMKAIEQLQESDVKLISLKAKHIVEKQVNKI